MQIKPVSRKQNIVVQELENELLVYDLRTNQAFCLNETSAIVFQLCDGTKSVAEISNLMSQQLKTLISEDFVKLALNELNRNGLLENTAEVKEFFEVFHRREMVKKVGLTSMIALPFITSVTAPRAVNAQSCISDGVSCTFNNFTQSDCCSDSRCGFDRLSPVRPICFGCRSSGQIFVACAFLGGCGGCNSAPAKNYCCDPSATATDDGNACLCG